MAQAQEAAQEAKELVQEQTALANEIRRQAEEARSEAGPLKLQVEQNEQQVRARTRWCHAVGLSDIGLDMEPFYQ